MGVKPVIFASGGRRTEHYIPGAYSRSVAIPNLSGGVSAGNVCIMGKSNSGKPQTLLAFSSVGEAEEVIDGELLKGVAYAFNPAPGYTPQRVFAMRVNKGTQSEFSFTKNGTTYMTVKPLLWGLTANNAALSVTDGSDPDTKKVSMTYRGGTDEVDNIRFAPLKIHALQNNVSVEVTADDVKVDDNSSVRVFTFNDNPLMSDIAEKLSATGVLEVEIEDSAQELASVFLDAFSFRLISSIYFDELRADGYAFSEALKQLPLIDPDTVFYPSQGFVGYPDDIPTPQRFQGAENGVYDTDAWREALKELEGEDIQIVSTPNMKDEVAVLIKNHCEIMGSVQNRKERKCWLGGAVGATLDQALAMAKSLKSSVASYCYPWITANNPLTGVSETVDASYYACMLAGLESAVDVHIPLTNKQMNIIKWGIKLNNAALEKAIKGGVCAGGFDEDKNLVNIRAVTTYQGYELQLCENSMVREDQYMNRDLRSAFQPSIGEPFIKGDTETAKATLTQKARQWAGYGYITPDDGGNDIWGVTISVSGDATYITFNRNLTSPRNFVFITARNYIYTSETSVGV